MYFSRLIHARFGSAICVVVLFGSTCLLSARAQQSAPVAQPAVDSAQPAATDASATAVAPADAAAAAPAAAPCTGKHCPRLK